MIRNFLAMLGFLGAVMAIAIGVNALGYDPFEPDQPRRLAVRFDGLDLSTGEGQRLLDQRIRRAINRVCDERSDGRNLRARQLEANCRRDARAGTEPQVIAAVDAAVRRARLADERAAQLVAAPVPAPMQSAYLPPSNLPPSIYEPAPMVRPYQKVRKATYTRPKRWVKKRKVWRRTTVRRTWQR